LYEIKIRQPYTHSSDVSFEVSILFQSVDKKLSKVVPHILPPPLKVMVDEAGKNTRLKPKRKQEVGKRGPMKAVVPVDNMTRASGLEKKGENFLHWVLSFHYEDVWVKHYTLTLQQLPSILTEDFHSFPKSLLPYAT
jgi:hypothetical protein